MHRRRMIGTALMLLLALAIPVRAGVYHPDAPPSQKSLDSPYQQIGRPAAARNVEQRLTDVQLVNDQGPAAKQPAPGSLRAAFLAYVDQLEAKRRQAALRTIDSINLSGSLLRLGRWTQALAVIEEALPRAAGPEGGRFLLLHNMAAAYRNNSDLLQRAIDTQRQALAAWPAEWNGWSHEQWAWYRRAEKTELALMQSRQREVMAGQLAVTTLDPIFPGVHWIGPSGRFEAGQLRVEEWDKLPLDAEPLVVQLMLWDPHDARLLWLYGELLNGRGQVPAAYEVLDRCVSSRGLSAVRELRNHRAILAQAKPEYESRAQAEEAKQLVPDSPPVQEPTPAAEVRRPTSSILPDWRALAVGFATGCVVTLLGVFQWRQMRRRHGDNAGRVAHAPGQP